MKKYRVIIAVALWAVALTLVGWMLFRGVDFAVLNPAGDVGVKQRDLLVFTVILSALVVVPVFSLLAVFAWRYRASNKAKYSPNWHHSLKLEALWWGIPILIIGVLSVITWQTSHSLDPYRPLASTKKPVEVQVVALQWKWLFIYPELGVASMNHLPVPVDVPVHFTLTADAPMSAFWIPALGSQIYTMNGMSSQLNLIANKSGNYEGYSTNINGAGYADMKFTVKATPQTQFEAWVSSARSSPDMMDEATYQELVKPGKASETSYMLMDTRLYDTIVEKYMGSHAPSERHEMHTMEGM